MSRKLKLDWTDYKSIEGSRSVWFSGDGRGFVLYVVCHDHHFKATKKWRVHWYDLPPIKGLSDKRFRSRLDAQRAAERVFVPMLQIAPRMVHVEIAKTVRH